MKPTMPMNAFPPGGPPMTPGGAAPPPGGTPPPGGGWPPPGGGGSGYGGGAPPSSFPQNQPAPKKSRTGLYVGIGCGCLSLMGCCIGSFVFFMMSVMPGDEVASTQISPGVPFSVSYTQSGDDRHKAWLEVDLDTPGGYLLSGNLLMSEGATAFGQYTLQESGEGSPVRERNSRTSWNWSKTNNHASGSVVLFPIPARADGSTVTVSGTIQAPPGTTGTIRLFVAKR